MIDAVPFSIKGEDGHAGARLDPVSSQQRYDSLGATRAQSGYQEKDVSAAQELFPTGGGRMHDQPPISG
jgi:hypothetical protein